MSVELNWKGGSVEIHVYPASALYQVEWSANLSTIIEYIHVLNN
jgi:hypothetical protein